MTSTDASFAAAVDVCEALLDARKFEEALRTANHIMSLSPERAQSYTLVTRALLGTGDFENACAAARQAVALEPQWPYAHRLLSRAIVESAARLKDGSCAQMSAQAIAPALEAVRLAPADFRNHLVAAEAFARAKHGKEADDAVKTAIPLAPRATAVWVTASLVAVNARNWEAAETAARRALAIEPSNAAAKNNLGAALNGRGRWDLAAVAFYQAAGIDPRSDIARSNVEAIGYRYMAAVLPFFLLPLLVVVPLFVAVRVSVSSWLVKKKPKRLGVVARQLGIRVATNGRHRRELERAAARALRSLESDQALETWSSLNQKWHRGHLGSPGFRWVAGTSAAALVFLIVVDAAGSLAGSWAALGAAILFVVAGLLMFQWQRTSTGHVRKMRA